LIDDIPRFNKPTVFFLEERGIIPRFSESGGH